MTVVEKKTSSATRSQALKEREKAGPLLSQLLLSGEEDGLLTLGTATWKFRPVAATFPFTRNRARISTTPGCVVERCGVREITRSFLLYALYDGRFGVAGLGGGAAAVTGGLKSNKLEAAAGGAAACGEAEGAGESKRLRISAAVVFCGWEASVGVVVDAAVDPPKISARRSSLVLWPPGTATTGSEGADISSPSKSALTKEIAGQGRGKPPGNEMATHIFACPG